MSDDFQQRGGSPWGTPPGGGSGNGSGRGPTPPDIDKIIRENSLNSHINFTKPTLDIKRLYEKSFLTINMSKRPEGFGRTISESLSMSRPVIAPDCGGVKEQLEFFDTNLLFKVDSYNSFKKSLDYAINNHKRIQKKSRDFVKEKFSSNLMCKNTLKIYKNLIF